MKSILALIIFCMSAMAFANDPDFCNGKLSCRKGYIPLIKTGTYFAKGSGKTCRQAMDNSQRRFQDEFGNMECGLISGPYVWSCTQHSKTKFSAWTRCNPDSGPTRTAPRSRCAMIGGRLFC